MLLQNRCSCPVCDIESVCVFLCLFNDNLYDACVYACTFSGMITCYIPATALIMYLSSNLMSTLVKERELRTSEEIDDVYDC